MTQVQISDDVLEDLAAGAWFYEIQEAGLGEYFYTCLRSYIERIQRILILPAKPFQNGF
jgi:hypothetical protein